MLGVDTHRDVHALAVVSALGAVELETQVAASGAGPGRSAVRGSACVRSPHLGDRRNRLLGRRPLSVLQAAGERVLEVDRPRRQGRSSGKSDPLDAIRAAGLRSPGSGLPQPRAAGKREELHALVAAREGALSAKRAGLCQLRALIVTAPEPLRDELRGLTRARLRGSVGCDQTTTRAGHAVSCSRSSLSPTASLSSPVRSAS